MQTGTYAPLHVHTEHSPLDGLARLDKLADACLERGIEAAAITDHGSLAGIWKWAQICRARGITPIPGMEAYLAIGSRHERNVVEEVDDAGMSDADDTAVDQVKTKRYHHLSLLAHNRTGWHNLIRLHNEAQRSIWYKPRIDYDLLRAHGEGLIVLTGCLASPVNSALKQMDYVDEDRQAELWGQACGELETIIDAVGADNVYIEVMDHGIEAEENVIGWLRTLAEEYELDMVATGDSHYIDPDDGQAHEAFLAVGTGAVLDDEKRFRFNGAGYHLKTYQEMISSYDEDFWVEAVDNTNAVAARIAEDTVPEPAMRLPKYPVDDSQAHLRAVVESGAEWRYGDDWSDDEDLVARIDHEMHIIVTMGFADYFLITEDLVSWARSDRGPDGAPGEKTPITVGLGRGSAAGSVTSYCLGIVGVDPIRADLLFERFLEPGREGMPDIDIDFPASRRDEVFEYLQHTWGHDHTARIGSPTVAKTKAAIKDAARVLKPHDPTAKREVFQLGEKMAKAVPEEGARPMSFAEMDADPTRAREYFGIVADETLSVEFDGEQVALTPVIDAYARAFEDITKSPGIHPCGFVISDEPLDDLVPTRQQKTGPQVSAFDGDDLEDMGFLKMDILGLENLDYLSTALETISEATGARISLDDIDDPDDEESPEAFDAFELIQQGRTAGVFQLEGEGVTALSKAVAPEYMEDLSALIALYRPGPMGADMHHTYARRKNGEEEPSYHQLTADPDEVKWLDTVLGVTYALPIYQEAVMQLGTVVAGFDDHQRSVLRKAIGKKKQKLMDQAKVWWDDGAVVEHRDESGELISPAFSHKTAGRVWDFIRASADYLFNRSHSYAYGMTAYYTAYLKAAYPAEYAAAVLSHTEKDEKRLATLNSLADEGITVSPPDVNASQVSTAASDGVVYYGLAEIKGVGKAAAAIVDQRPDGGYTSLDDLRKVTVNGRKVTKTQLLGLGDAGALDCLGDRHQLRTLIEPKSEADSPVARVGRQLRVIGVILDENPLDLIEDHHVEAIGVESEAQAHTEAETVEPSYDHEGYERRPAPLASLTGAPTVRLSRIAEEPSSSVVALGITTSRKVFTTRRGQKMAKLELTDGRRRQQVLVFPSVAEQKGEDRIPAVGDLTVVSGRLKAEDDSDDLMFFATWLWAVADPLTADHDDDSVVAVEHTTEAELAPEDQGADSDDDEGDDRQRPADHGDGNPNASDGFTMM